MFVISPSESVSCCHLYIECRSSLQVNTAVVGTRGVPLPVHNIIVAVEQTIPDLQKKWTRFGDNRRVYAMLCTVRVLLPVLHFCMCVSVVGGWFHCKRLKRGDENELERKLRLEKVVNSKQLRLAVKKSKT